MKIRISKFEIRNKAILPSHCSFQHLNFGFVSDLDIRISCFNLQSHTPSSKTRRHAIAPLPSGFRRSTSRTVRNRGIILPIVLLAILLLGSLLFYVLNIGRQVNRRITTQNSADAAAAAAATWVARSMNTVAMNNTEMARSIALINVLDSLPLAIDLTVLDPTETAYDDLEALRIAVPWQLGQSISDPWFRQALERMDFRVQEEDTQLQALDTYFRQFPDLVPSMTHYNAPSGERGSIWRAMMTMDEMNQASLDSLRLTAQAAAVEGGRLNLLQSRGVEGADAASVAVVSGIPWSRGQFNDFRRPVMQGLLPEAVDDMEFRRGPWDAVFGWRNFDGDRGDPGGRIPGPGNPPVSSGPRPSSPPNRYSTYGPQSWMISHLTPHRYDEYHRLRWWLARLARIKASYIWPNSGTPAGTQSVIDPDWEVDIARDNERSQDANDTFVYQIADEDRSRIRETLFVVGEIKSRLADTSGLLSQQGVSWEYIRRPGVPVPYLHRVNGWRDPRSGPVFNVRSASPVTWRQIDTHIWRLSATYMTNPLQNGGGDVQIGLAPLTSLDADGNIVFLEQEVHWELDVMLVGVNVGEDIEVRNPYAGFSSGSADAPAPSDLRHDLLPHSSLAARRNFLTVFAVAGQRSPSLIWTERFDRRRPTQWMVATAQAHVFNNHSWDLWTQMWHAQLQPIDNYNDWLIRLENYPDDAPSRGDAARLAELIGASRTLADAMLHH